MGKQQQQREVSSWAGLATTVYDEQAEEEDFLQRGTRGGDGVWRVRCWVGLCSSVARRPRIVSCPTGDPLTRK